MPVREPTGALNKITPRFFEVVNARSTVPWEGAISFPILGRGGDQRAILKESVSWGIEMRIQGLGPPPGRWSLSSLRG